MLSAGVSAPPRRQLMNDVTTDSDRRYLVVDSPHELARWRPLVNWVLYIPHAIILYALQILARVVFLVYWLMLVFTGKLHPGLYGVMAMYERYNARRRVPGRVLRDVPAVRLLHRHRRRQRLPGGTADSPGSTSVGAAFGSAQRAQGNSPLRGADGVLRRRRSGGVDRLVRRALHRRGPRACVRSSYG